MNISDFCTACEWLAGDGIQINKAAYDGEAFGSWFIDVPHRGKLLRAVWDGRDCPLVIQSQVTADAWNVEWIAREADEQIVEQVVTRLRNRT